MTATPATSTHSIFRAEGFSCPSCVAKIEKQVGRLKGVQNVSVKFASGRVEVDHDASVTTTDEIVAAIGKAGYKAAPSAFSSASSAGPARPGRALRPCSAPDRERHHIMSALTRWLRGPWGTPIVSGLLIVVAAIFSLTAGVNPFGAGHQHGIGFSLEGPTALV